MVVTGPETIEAYRSVRADVYVLGAAGLHIDAGITVLDPAQAQVQRAMLAGAGQVIAVMSSEKLGTAGPFVVAPIDALTDLVTDDSVSEETLAPFAERGIRI